MDKLDGNIDQLSNTFVERTGKTSILKEYNTGYSDTKSNLKEYYDYPNSEVGSYKNYRRCLVNVDCSKNTFFKSRTNTPKVFIRKVDNKRSLNDKSYNVINGVFGNDHGNHKYTSNNFAKLQQVEAYNYDVDAIEHRENSGRHTSFVDDYNHSVHSNMYYDNNAEMELPLCVKEANSEGQRSNIPYSLGALNPVNPINHDDFFNNYYLPEVQYKYNIHTKSVANYIYIFFKYIYKLLNLTIQKIKKDFNTSEIRVDPEALAFYDMDIECSICRDKYGKVIKEIHNKDCLSYFEAYDESQTLFTKLWNILNNWLDGKEVNKLNLSKSYSINNQELYYDNKDFPTDENGKIELPEFEAVSQ